MRKRRSTTMHQDLEGLKIAIESLDRNLSTFRTQLFGHPTEENSEGRFPRVEADVKSLKTKVRAIEATEEGSVTWHQDKRITFLERWWWKLVGGAVVVWAMVEQQVHHLFFK